MSNEENMTGNSYNMPENSGNTGNMYNAQTDNNSQMYNAQANNNQMYNAQANNNQMYNAQANNNQMYNAPVNNSSNMYNAPITPKKKKKWPIVVGVVAALAVAGGAAASYWFFFRTPSFTTPTEAITSCMAQLDTQFSTEELGGTALEERLDSETMLKNIEEKGSQMNCTFTLEDSDISELSMLEGTTFGYSAQNDVKNQSMYGSVNASVMGMGADIGFYYDKDKFALLSDELLPNAYLAVNKSDIQKALEEELSKAETKEIMSMLEQQSTKMLSGIQDFSDYSMKQLPDSLVSFAKSWDIDEKTDSGKTKKLKIGGKEYDCYSYDVTISSKDFQEFLEDYCTYLSKYDFENNEYFSMLEKTYQLEGSMSFNKQLSDMLEELPDAIDGSEDETLELTMHIAPKGQLLGIDMDYEEDGNSLDMEIRFGGEKPGQEIYMDISIDDSYETLNYNLSSSRKTEKKKEINTASLKFDIDGEGFEIEATTTFDTSDKDELPFTADLSFDMDIDGEQISASAEAEGTYTNIEKGKSCDSEIDTLTITVDSDEFSQSIELSCELSMGVLSDSMKKLPKKSYDLLNLSDSDIEEIAEIVSETDLVKTFLGTYVTPEDIEDLIKEMLDEAENMMY